MKLSDSKKTKRQDQKIKFNINGSKTCQHSRGSGYPNHSGQSYDIYACTLPIGHEGDHGVGGWFGPWPNEGPNPNIKDLSNIKVYLVGGAVREIVRGNATKVNDWDFAVEAESFDTMREWLNAEGFEIFLETPQYFTIRAKSPKSGFTFAGRDMSGRTFDFTLCRTEGEYLDGRHPESVEVGTIKSDLSRRDFTMNAIAMDSEGMLIDPFGGTEDAKNGTIRCVGSTDRLKEDALRMLRAVRFAIQIGGTLDQDINDFLHDEYNINLLEKISEERIREELTKAFKVDTLETLWYLSNYTVLRDKVFEGDMWLMPTVKGTGNEKTKGWDGKCIIF
jgi:hypothetical protein